MKKEKLYLLIVGSRTFTNYEAMKRKTDYMLQNYSDVVIISGGARGADSLAKRYAKERNFEYVEFPADWDKYGKQAGYIRNGEMHKYLSQYKDRACLAFWDGQSKGTKQNFSLCEKYGTQFVVVNVNIPYERVYSNNG